MDKDIKKLQRTELKLNLCVIISLGIALLGSIGGFINSVNDFNNFMIIGTTCICIVGISTLLSIVFSIATSVVRRKRKRVFEAKTLESPLTSTII
jgi:hypothetical protein